MHHCAKFYQNQPIHCEALLFFDLLRWWPSTIFDFFEAYLDHPHLVLGGLYHSAEFIYDLNSSFDNMNVSILCTFGWKIPIQVPKIVLGLFDPLNRPQYQRKLLPKIMKCCLMSVTQTFLHTALNIGIMQLGLCRCIKM